MFTKQDCLDKFSKEYATPTTEITCIGHGGDVVIIHYVLEEGMDGEQVQYCRHCGEEGFDDYWCEECETEYTDI